MSEEIRGKIIMYLAKIYFSEPKFWIAGSILENKIEEAGYNIDEAKIEINKLVKEGRVWERETRGYVEYQYIPDLCEIQHVIEKLLA